MFNWLKRLFRRTTAEQLSSLHEPKSYPRMPRVKPPRQASLDMDGGENAPYKCLPTQRAGKEGLFDDRGKQEEPRRVVNNATITPRNINQFDVRQPWADRLSERLNAEQRSSFGYPVDITAEQADAEVRHRRAFENSYMDPPVDPVLEPAPRHEPAPAPPASYHSSDSSTNDWNSSSNDSSSSSSSSDSGSSLSSD